MDNRNLKMIYFVKYSRRIVVGWTIWSIFIETLPFNFLCILIGFMGCMASMAATNLLLQPEDFRPGICPVCY